MSDEAFVPLEISDFSGGMTDNIFSGVVNRYEKAENLEITDDNKPITRPGSDVVDLAFPRVPSAAHVRTLPILNGELLYQSGRKLYYKDVTGFHEIIGPASFPNPVYSNGNASSYASFAEWNNHLITVSNFPSRPMRVFKDGSNYKVHNLGLPKYNGTPTMGGIAHTGGTNVHAYACHYESTYSINGVTFLERGPVTFFGESDQYSPIGGAQIVTIAPSAELVTNSTDNYDKDNIKIVFYRNTNAGRVWYRVGDMPTNQTTFTDNKSDGELVLGSPLYIDGGVKDHDQPPEAKYIHQTNDILYLGAVVENGILRANKLRMSNRFMLWSCPASFEEEFEEEITGISSIGIYPIVFCKNSVYRLDGFYDEQGRGTVKKKRISDSIGCVSARSIIRTEDGAGIFFAANNGFYFCNGSEVWRVSDELNKTYLTLVKAGRLENIVGSYNGVEKKIYWAVTTVQGAADNDSIFVGHLAKATPRHLPMTVWNGGLVKENFKPVCLATINDVLYRADNLGYVFYHDREITFDKLTDPLVAPNLWKRVPIIYNLQGICLDFGTSSVRKWVPFMTLNANNVADLHLSIFSSNDNVGEGFEKQLKDVQYKGRFEWGNPSLGWGEDVILNVFPVITAKRRFPKGGIRCNYRQIRFTNGKRMITESEINGTAMVDNALKKVTPTTYPTYAWPTNLYSVELSFGHDDFKEHYTVIDIAPDEIEVENPLTTLPSGEQEWRLYAYPTDEIFNLISYTIWYANSGPTQEAFRSQK